MTDQSPTDSTVVAERPRDDRGRFAKDRTSGAPGENRNAIRHGLMAGRLPKGAGYVRRETDQLRTLIENAVAAANGGEISLNDAACIQTAIRWERHALLAQRWLRLEAETLTPDQRLAFSRDVARASAERDKCLKSLGLDVRPGSDPWAVLDTLPPADSANGQDHTAGNQDGDTSDDSDQGADSAIDEQSDVSDDGSNDGGTKH